MRKAASVDACESVPACCGTETLISIHAHSHASGASTPYMAATGERQKQQRGRCVQLYLPLLCRSVCNCNCPSSV